MSSNYLSRPKGEREQEREQEREREREIDRVENMINTNAVSCLSMIYFLMLLMPCLRIEEVQARKHEYQMQHLNQRSFSHHTYELLPAQQQLDKNIDVQQGERVFRNERGNGSGQPKVRRGHRKKSQHHPINEDENISLWINDQQLKMLTALFFPRANAIGRMYAIKNGSVLYDILDGSAYKYLEYLVLPPEVNYVNFTWKSGHRKYFYHFDRLETLNDNVLKTPTLSIKAKGRIPKEEKDFSVFLPCNGNNSGTAVVKISLSIHNRKGVSLPGTPLRLNFKKGCAHRGPDPECHLKCGEHGTCNHNNICQCHPGYIGQYCETPVCFPQCMNGGNCTAPSVCTCPDGYQGIKCEGGMCAEKCLNGGKCIKKDKCECPRGYYGLRCEFSKCEISCMHGGRCIGTNLCKCAPGLSGDHCEIGQKQRPTCKDNCKFGHCLSNNKCKCLEGYYGRFCNRRPKRMY
ncbi:WNT inhibitory factor 1 isoform 2-T2 [Glossina fuscipes fuscipes]